MDLFGPIWTYFGPILDLFWSYLGHYRGYFIILVYFNDQKCFKIMGNIFGPILDFLDLFWTYFGSILDQFWNSLGHYRGYFIIIVYSNDQKCFKIVGNIFGPILDFLDLFWTYFGSILDQFWNSLGHYRGYFIIIVYSNDQKCFKIVGNIFGPILDFLDLFWIYFGPILELFRPL